MTTNPSLSHPTNKYTALHSQLHLQSHYNDQWQLVKQQKEQRTTFHGFTSEKLLYGAGDVKEIACVPAVENKSASYNNPAEEILDYRKFASKPVQLIYCCNIREPKQSKLGFASRGVDHKAVLTLPADQIRNGPILWRHFAVKRGWVTMKHSAVGMESN
ncbi:hypothetical protein CEXT_248701 [Caerostris extrusa]|uniref:Uncharacterized protein n=1 Tax=Caerostris extrusa TaxID=172846 RepID=A0AAV4RVZ2_CAEEX|nr:hypothetical protein CEXT_248701 [Caerostris extrusa]